MIASPFNKLGRINEFVRRLDPYKVPYTPFKEFSLMPREELRTRTDYRRRNIDKSTKARTRDSIARLEGSTPGAIDSVKPDRGSVKRGVSHTTVNKSTVKSAASSSPRKLDPKSFMQKARGSKWLKIGLVVAGMVVSSNFLNSFADRTYGHIMPTAQRVGLWSRESTYIPEKYSRGYDTIKQSLTDFGSRVNLSKTAMKVNVTPPSSTRNGMIRTTGSITRSNIALRAHSNAIQHTRY